MLLAWLGKYQEYHLRCLNYSNQIKGLNDDVRKQILRADVAKLPAYSGVETPAGYTLIRITRTVEPEKIDVEHFKFTFASSFVCL